MTDEDLIITVIYNCFTLKTPKENWRMKEYKNKIHREVIFQVQVSLTGLMIWLRFIFIFVKTYVFLGLKEMARLEVKTTNIANVNRQVKM